MRRLRSPGHGKTCDPLREECVANPCLEAIGFQLCAALIHSAEGWSKLANHSAGGDLLTARGLLHRQPAAADHASASRPLNSEERGFFGQENSLRSLENSDLAFLGE